VVFESAIQHWWNSLGPEERASPLLNSAVQCGTNTGLFRGLLWSQPWDTIITTLSRPLAFSIMMKTVTASVALQCPGCLHTDLIRSCETGFWEAVREIIRYSEAARMWSCQSPQVKVGGQNMLHFRPNYASNHRW
jgi:hypothetical protein